MDENIFISAIFFTSEVDRNSSTSDFGRNLLKEGTEDFNFYNSCTKFRKITKISGKNEGHFENILPQVFVQN